MSLSINKISRISSFLANVECFGIWHARLRHVECLGIWGEALYSACHFLNRVPSKKFEKTCYQLWRKKEPNLKYLKVWECLSKVNIPINKKRKIGPKLLIMFLLYILCIVLLIDS